MNQPSPLEDGCALCRKSRFYFDAAVSIGNYQASLQTTLREMKRASSENIAFQLGIVLGKIIRERLVGADIDVIVPIPIHWWSRMKRGFNAASLISRGIANEIQKPILDGALKFTRKTKKQGRLSTAARIKNLSNAIAVRKPSLITGQNILLVDDVMTSGATANEASKMMKKSGAETIIVAIAARGVRAS